MNQYKIVDTFYIFSYLVFEISVYFILIVHLNLDTNFCEKYLICLDS